MLREVQEVLEAQPTIEGAGVHLRRAFGHREVPRLDPFLLLDDFRSENPAEYVAGFPWHPHRGIETVTYILDGRVDHEDSLGNKGAIGPGDVQWMTSGRGIIHQEMPRRMEQKKMGGFQLWVNLPHAQKMGAPGYQEVQHERIPVAEPARGVRARVVAGETGRVRGPVKEIAVQPEFLDLHLEPGVDYTHPTPPAHTSFGYLIEGSASFDAEAKDRVDDGNLVLFGPGDGIRIRSGDRGARLLLISGKPLHEPVAWWGPIVMNNRKELEQAVEEYQNGTFLDPPKSSPQDAPGSGS
ncbi:MAG TPA: pirin family protein [Thermoplasmata archaeon]|nr:pirin family protein [Thermoplasmata archaeon]